MVSDFRPIIFNSATQKEINDLGLKYGIEIPKTLNGDALREYLKGKLKVKNVLDKYKNFDSLKISELRDIAKNENIYIAITLNKQESIEYIIQRYEKTKNDYEIPLNKSVYQMNIPIDQNEDKYQEVYIEFLKGKDEIKSLKESLNGKTAEEKIKINNLIIEKEELVQKQNQELEDLKNKFKNNSMEYQDEIEKLKEELKIERENTSFMLSEKEREKNDLLLMLKGLKENRYENENNISTQELEEKLRNLENEDNKLQEEILKLKANASNDTVVEDKKSIKNENEENILTIREILTIMKQVSNNENITNNDLMVIESKEEKSNGKQGLGILIPISIVLSALICFLILYFTIK